MPARIVPGLLIGFIVFLMSMSVSFFFMPIFINLT